MYSKLHFWVAGLPTINILMYTDEFQYWVCFPGPSPGQNTDFSKYRGWLYNLKLLLLFHRVVSYLYRVGDRIQSLNGVELSGLTQKEVDHQLTLVPRGLTRFVITSGAPSAGENIGGPSSERATLGVSETGEGFFIN